MIIAVVQIPMPKRPKAAAAEAWYTPEWIAKATATFRAKPTITYYETT